MNDAIIHRIRSSMQAPIIGVIGGTVPTAPYEAERGVGIGYHLREHIDTRPGTLFTGGVSGVGIDVFRGVVDYCLKWKAKQKGRLPDTKFFVLVPKYFLEPEQGLGFVEYGSPGNVLTEYNPPKDYLRLAALTKERHLHIETAGNDMAERREFVAKIADVLVLANGSYGTLDEAVHGLRNNVPLLVMNNTGGAAALIGRIKQGEVNNGLIEQLKGEGIDLEGINLKLINTVQDPTMLSRSLDELISR